MVKHFEEMAAVSDSIEVCKNTYNNMEVLNWDETAELLNAATGWDLSGEDVRRIGERIVNLERAFIAREGITRADAPTVPNWAWSRRASGARRLSGRSRRRTVATTLPRPRLNTLQWPVISSTSSR